MRAEVELKRHADVGTYFVCLTCTKQRRGLCFQNFVSGNTLGRD